MSRKQSYFRKITSVFLSSALILTSCTTVGTDYTPPEIPSPPGYKEATSREHGFRPDWWRSFGDARLNALQARLISQNRELVAARARYEQSLAALGVARSNKFPQVSVNGSITRNENSSSGTFGNAGRDYFTLYEVTGNLGYEIDLWGRVRRLVEAGNADAQAAALAMEDVRVALQTQLARTYFALRFLDAEAAVLRTAVQTRKESLQLAEDRLAAGLTSELDASRARSELAAAEAELLSLVGPRAQLENSIAVLIGKHASTFSINPESNTARLPSIPAGVPAGLLSRRPDVAAAERQLAASSARIGVAKGEFFPKISLTGRGGRSSISSGNFLEASSRTWSIGPSLDVPLFTGGRLKSNLTAARAKQKEDLARFQQAALKAFADVESALAQVDALAREDKAREATVGASRTSFELAQLRYTEGADSYLNVIDSQRVLLNAERAEVQTRGQRYAATIQLIQALGGGFNR